MNLKTVPVLALPCLLLAGGASAQTPALTISDVTAPEGNSGSSNFVFTVTLAPASASIVKVKWSTETCTATPKEPCADGDYNNADGTLTFSPGETVKTIPVEVFGDTTPEGQEVFFVALRDPINAVLSTLPQGQGQGIIDNDDGALVGPAADVNADGKTDILWRHAVSNRLVGWTMNGLNKLGGDYVTQGGTPIAVDAGSRVVGFGDVDGDGDADVVLQSDATGDLEYRYLNGLVQTDQRSLTGQGAAWQVVGMGDFNADDHLDLLWRNSVNGNLNVWYMNDRTFLGSANLTPLFVPTVGSPSVPDLNWKVAAVADFDGDGDADILFRHDFSLRNVIWYLDGVVRVDGGYVDPDRPIDFEQWPLAGAWDVDQDGVADLVFRHNVSGAIVAWFLDKKGHRRCGTYFNPPTLADLNWSLAGPR
jgi:hypothetical protein